MTVPPPVSDLWDALDAGLALGGGLLTPDEHALVAVIRALDGEPALLFARWFSRTYEAYPVSELAMPGVDRLADAVDVLVEAGLATYAVPWPERAVRAKRGVLVAGCKRLGLPATGTRPVLAERLLECTDWDDVPWARLDVSWIVRRLWRWASLRAWPDPSQPVVERLGHVRWPDYPLSEGPVLEIDRLDWLRWESVVDGWEDLEADDCLVALTTLPVLPRGLDIRRALAERVMELSQAYVRAGQPGVAAEWLERLASMEVLSGARLPVRWARALEKDGRTREALTVLRAATVEGPGRLALARAGRRTAKSVGAAWRPEPPRPEPQLRELRLDGVVRDGYRPLYAVGDAAYWVEEAVRQRLALEGRVAVHAEGGLWSTLFALLFADASFLPIRGQLPVPRLSGPLDRGTPAFAARRPEAVWEVLDAVDAGQAPERVAQAWDTWAGVRLSGARWDWPVEVLTTLVAGVGRKPLGVLLRRMLREGRRATRGLPDLVVLPGDSVAVDGAWPSRLPAELMWVEVKGEGDRLRDEQVWWLGLLREAGAHAEVWRVTGGAGSAGVDASTAA